LHGFCFGKPRPNGNMRAVLIRRPKCLHMQGGYGF